MGVVGCWADLRWLGLVRVAGSGPRVGLCLLHPVACVFFRRPLSLLVNVISTSFFPPFSSVPEFLSPLNSVFCIGLVRKGLTLLDLEEF